MASGGGKQPSQSKQKSSGSKKEEMESFMSKVCERFEKLQVLSRLLEQPEQQSQGSSKSRQKLSRSRKVYNDVYQFFCDQPSTSQGSKSKTASKEKQSESELLDSNISENIPSGSGISKIKPSDSNVSEINPSGSRISVTKPSESKKSKTKSSESKVSEITPLDSRIFKTKPSESSMPETNPSESRISKTKPSESKKSKTKSSEGSVSETNPSESRISKTKPLESKKSKPKSSEGSVPETNPSESRISKTKPSESKKSKTKSSEGSVSETNPSESRLSKTKSSEDSVSKVNPSDSSMSKIKPSGSSKRISSKKKKASVEKFDTADLSQEGGDNWSSIPTVELPAPTESSIFKGQPYIENPDEPSTSSGVRVVKLDEFVYPEFPSESELSQEEAEQEQSNIITSAERDDSTTTVDVKEYLKRPNLRSIQKKPRLSSRSEKVSAIESVITVKDSHSKAKQEKPEMPSDATDTGGKIDLKNVRASDLRGRLIFKLNEAIQNQMVPYETPKTDRAQRARERLRRKFERGQSASSKKKSK